MSRLVPFYLTAFLAAPTFAQQLTPPTKSKESPKQQPSRPPEKKVPAPSPKPAANPPGAAPAPGKPVAPAPAAPKNPSAPKPSETAKAPAPPVGPAQRLAATVTNVRGVVTVKTPKMGDPVSLPAGRTETIVEGTVIGTGVNSEALLKVGSMEYRVSENSGVILSEALLATLPSAGKEPPVRTQRVRYAIRYGEVKIKVPKSGDLKTDAEFVTPEATHSIRGTELVLRRYPDVTASDADVFYVHIEVSEGRVHSESPHLDRDVDAGDRFDHTLVAREDRQDRYRRIRITPEYGESPGLNGLLIGVPGDLSASGYSGWILPAGANPDYFQRILSHERAGLPLPPGPPGSSP